jgi:hypothetical protein
MTLVTFIIPVRHQENSSDWPALRHRLSETVRSISAQTHSDWRGVIVANHGADLPQLPERFSVERVSFPPNPMHDMTAASREKVLDSFRLDKGRRVLAGMLAHRDTDYFMIVDDDDFVSSRLVDHVSAHKGENGWKITKGWVWSEGGRLALQHDDFSNYCGSSLMIRSDLYDLPDSFSSATEDYMKSSFGSHVRIGRILADKGTPLAPLPFRGAVYRVGHSGAHSKSSGLLRGHVFTGAALRRPRRLIGSLGRTRFVTRAFRTEFFGER